MAARQQIFAIKGNHRSKAKVFFDEKFFIKKKTLIQDRLCVALLNSQVQFQFSFSLSRHSVTELHRVPCNYCISLFTIYYTEALQKLQYNLGERGLAEGYKRSGANPCKLVFLPYMQVISQQITMSDSFDTK